MGALCMVPVFARGLGFAVLLMAGQRVAAYLPVIGWFASSFPVTWGLWIWAAARLVGEGRQELEKTGDPKISAMGWAAAVGALSGFASVVIQVVLGFVMAFGASATGSLLGLSGALAVAGGSVAFFTRPVFGMLVAGVAGLVLTSGRKLDASA